MLADIGCLSVTNSVGGAEPGHAKGAPMKSQVQNEWEGVEYRLGLRVAALL